MTVVDELARRSETESVEPVMKTLSTKRFSLGGSIRDHGSALARPAMRREGREKAGFLRCEPMEKIMSTATIGPRVPTDRPSPRLIGEVVS